METTKKPRRVRIPNLETPAGYPQPGEFWLTHGYGLTFVSGIRSVYSRTVVENTLNTSDNTLNLTPEAWCSRINAAETLVDPTDETLLAYVRLAENNPSIARPRAPKGSPMGRSVSSSALIRRLPVSVDMSQGIPPADLLIEAMRQAIQLHAAQVPTP